MFALILLLLSLLFILYDAEINFSQQASMNDMLCTYVCMHVCPKRQLEVSISSEKEVRKTGNPVNRKNPILKTNMQL